MPAMSARRLSAAQREALSDARLLLDTASHNLQAVVRATAPAGDLDQALANAHRQIQQVLAILEVMQVKRGEEPPTRASN
jgi:hypothetical protein